MEEGTASVAKAYYCECGAVEIAASKPNRCPACKKPGLLEYHDLVEARLAGLTPDEIKVEQDFHQMVERDKQHMADGRRRIEHRLLTGAGRFYAMHLQHQIERLGNHAAARKLGVSVDAIKRLRKRKPLEKVVLKGMPKP